MNNPNLLDDAIEALKSNDLGDWTRPAPGLYPHQWLWDSCFIAIGLSNINVKRAKKEIESLFRGQWSNGMMPHMIFASSSQKYHAGPTLWDSHASPFAPTKLNTSGITQPPMLAEAIVRIGQKMKKPDRIKWYRKLFPRLLAYHQWLYEDRDPHGTGLVINIHPWETGMDNTPPWMHQMAEHQMPYWIKAVKLTHLDHLVEKFRRDTAQVSADERMTTLEGLMLYNVARRLRRKNYDIDRILTRSHFMIEDVFFNSVLIRANEILKDIAKQIDEDIPATTLSSMNMATKAINELWDDETGMYYNRNFILHDFIAEPTIASLMPLYTGVISHAKAKRIVELLRNPNHYGTKFGVPTVPLSSPDFDERRYWQGPAWINMNWLMIDGLKRYGFNDEASKLRQSSLELVSRFGTHEYFSPVNGFGIGVEPFSWTAALTIDLIKNP
jgi:neutral trehalase